MKQQIVNSITNVCIFPYCIYNYKIIIEANIADEMTKCRQAINEKNWVGLLSVAQSIAAKGRRLVEVGKVTVETISDPLQKTMITEALNDLEKS